MLIELCVILGYNSKTLIKSKVGHVKKSWRKLYYIHRKVGGIFFILYSIYYIYTVC